MPQKNHTSFLAAVFFGAFLRKCKYFEDQSTKCRDFLYLGVLRGGGSESEKISEKYPISADIRILRISAITRLRKHILSWFFLYKLIYHRRITYPKIFEKSPIRTEISAFFVVPLVLVRNAPFSDIMFRSPFLTTYPKINRIAKVWAEIFASDT